jgi:spermidine/putrescine transport system ATP-binding protein
MHSVDSQVPAASNQLAGRVRDASYLGVSTQYIVETRDGKSITVYEQNVERTVHGSLHRPGEEVRLSWSPDHTFAVRTEPGPTEEALAAG